MHEADQNLILKFACSSKNRLKNKCRGFHQRLTYNFWKLAVIVIVLVTVAAIPDFVYTRHLTAHCRWVYLCSLKNLQKGALCFIHALEATAYTFFPVALPISNWGFWHEPFINIFTAGRWSWQPRLLVRVIPSHSIDQPCVTWRWRFVLTFLLNNV